MLFSKVFAPGMLLLLFFVNQSYAWQVGGFKGDDVKLGNDNSVFDKPLGVGAGSVDQSLKKFEKVAADTVKDFKKSLDSTLKIANNSVSDLNSLVESNLNIKISADLSQEDLNGKFSFAANQLESKVNAVTSKQFREISASHKAMMDKLVSEASKTGTMSTQEVQKLLNDANQVKQQALEEIRKAVTANREALNTELTRIKDDLDRELSKAKEDVDRELTKSKNDTDVTLGKAWQDVVTEWNYFGATLCGEKPEAKAIRRKYDQGEITREEHDERLTNIGIDPDKKCGGGIQSDGDGNTALLDANGTPSDVPASTAADVSVDSIVVWNAAVEMRDMFESDVKGVASVSELSLWQLNGMGNGLLFSYVSRLPAASVQTTIPSKPPVAPSSPSAPSLKSVLSNKGPKIIKFIKWAGDLKAEIEDNDKLGRDVERIRDTLKEDETGSYTVLYHGKNYYGLSKINTDLGPQLRQGVSTDYNPYAARLNLRPAVPGDSIPFYKIEIYPVIDFYKNEVPDLSDEEIKQRIKSIYQVIPAEQHKKTWKELEKDIDQSLREDSSMPSSTPLG